MENKKTNLEKKIEEIKLFEEKLNDWLKTKDGGVFKIPNYLKAEVMGEVKIIQKFAEMENRFSPTTYPTQCYYRTNIPGVAYAVSGGARPENPKNFVENTEEHRLLSGKGWLKELDSIRRSIGGNYYSHLDKIKSEMPNGFEWYEAEAIMQREYPSSPGV